MPRKITLENVEVIPELEKAGISYDVAGPEEVRFRCPFHEDSNPSFYLNTRLRRGICRSAVCAKSADIVSVLAAHLIVDRNTVTMDLSSRYDMGVTMTIDPNVVEKFYTQIKEAGPLLSALYDRGITDEMIRRARIGYDAEKKRLTIPIFDSEKRVVNLRRYLPGAPSSEKMKNAVGYGGLTLYQPEQLSYETVWVCGGELKALLAGSLLNEFNVGAVAPTGGEGSWTKDFTELFLNKKVFVCCDVDEAGLAASRKWARFLKLSADSVKIIRLPLDKDKYPKGDINDFIGKEKATKEDLRKLMDVAEEFILDDEIPSESVIEEVHLADAASARMVGKSVKTEAIVTAMDTTPYIIPRDISVTCDRNQAGCSVCPIYPTKPDANGVIQVSVKATSSAVLTLVDSVKAKQRDHIREALKIPACKVVTFHVKNHYDAYDVRLTPQLQIGSSNSQNVVQPAFVIGRNPELNVPYVFSGRVYPSPKSQQAILLLDSLDQSQDDFSFFQPTDEELAELKIFQPKKSIQEQLDDIYKDLEANVTRIFHRRDLHLVVDLTIHSALYIPFDSRSEKGWVNSIVAGDSAQGKSETSLRLMQHYRVGERVECKNATRAGLLGGLQQLGSRWFISWGVIPTHDRRFLVMEEIKGTSLEVLTSLTDMRSSGVAEIAKIEKRRAHARTRLMMVSNPRSDRPISAYNFGIEVIKELVGGLEDVRRFDIALLTAASQVDQKYINQIASERPLSSHKYTSALCRRLILWGWTRKLSDIRFESKAEDACSRHAERLCGKFSDSMPLIDRGTTRHKLARLATALAIRLFSSKDGISVEVKTEHVEFIAEFLDRIYSDPVMGYADFSKAQEFASKVIEPEAIKRRISGVKYPSDLVEHLLHSEEVTLADLCDWCDVDKDNGQQLLSFFVRKHALYRSQKIYVKTSGFISLLKQMRETGISNDVVIDASDRM